MDPSSLSVSLIIPCYNSSTFLNKELPEAIDYLHQNFYTFEVILVDDGSNDVAETMHISQKNNCILLQQPTNKGKGAALRLGFSSATGAIRIFTDSDFPFEMHSLKEMYRLLSTDKADIVIGDRTNPSSDYYVRVSLVRKLGSFLIAGIGKRLLRNHIVDTQCGLKGFHAKAADAIFPLSITDRFGIDFELLLIASRQQMRIAKIPVSLRSKYPSSVNALKDGLRILVEIFKVILKHGRSSKANRR